MITLLAPIIVPVLGALGYVVAGWRRSTAWVSAGSAVLVLATAIATALDVARSGPRTAIAGLLRVDALSAFMLIVIGAVALLATIATPAFLRAEITAGRATARTATRHSVLVQLFLAAMALAVLAANLGVVWVAIEATTIVTAFLVGQRRTRAAVEAAWKYVVICSAGIALALLGTIVLNYAASRAPGGAVGLDLAALAANASMLDSGVTRIAVVLLILGFGTKAGLAPLHAWLPDAHSQAPAPVSALMSGVLLSVAFYAILRVKVIADGALGTGFARTALAVMAIASLLVAASLLLAQRDYKRMLAYSSIEHLGLVALGAAIGGPLALAAVLLHILGHGLAKGVLFLGAGRILQVTGTSRIGDDQGGVRGLAARHPVLAGCVGVGVLALIGLPPFSLFASELGIARAGFAAGMGWVTAAALILVLVIAAVLVGHTSRMLLGTPPDGPGAATTTRHLPWPTAIALVGGLLACATLGVTAGPLSSLLHLAADTLVGAR
ncbi:MULTISPECIES: proton-conducting transporter membrane subunit [Pseudonocardiaceae]|uniref:Hydrogenase n=2 Tax=Pseudonocardiaceae TaxID=2070 RepID=A0A2V4AE21_9PSEU|nr:MULTISPECIES: proton-conducting transporter membrane subunit [Pseudonocardiaceae]PXY17002.1 hydrogenase [Prauserella muralis]TWE23651.1 hydrogenase-4 component F [Prauserella muralis]WIV57949.1 proton-conducting transporter membrane subunit [Amycolatopsis sp. 2-2]